MIAVGPYREDQFDEVDALWRLVFTEDPPHSHADAAIPAKLATQRELFLTATEHGHVLGTVMGGYDGHRGWIYKLAVHPNARDCGIGERLVRATEDRLTALGCLKINLQVRLTNQAVSAFWKRMGYDVEPLMSMGKRL